MIDTVGFALVSAALSGQGQDLAETLWQDHAEDAGGLWRCPGGYASSAMPPRDADSASFSIVAQAEAITSLGTQVDAVGNVEIRQGSRRLAAHASTFDEATLLAQATGEVRFDEPGLSMGGASATVDFAVSRARVEAAEFVLTELQLRGRASRIERDGDTVQLDAATVTSCPPANAPWHIRARSIRLDAASRMATSRHARLKLGGVPVFYAPYLRFPTGAGRASGFLVPDIYGGRDGVDVSAPYYVNLAPNYDATLTPRWIARRGLGLEGEVRHRSRGAATGLDAAFLPDDRDHETARAGAGTGTGTAAGGSSSRPDRWSIHVDHRGRWSGLRTGIDFTAVSDDAYFGDFAAAQGVDSRVALERRGEVEYVRGNLTARLFAQAFQSLEAGYRSYRRLPEVGVSYAGALAGPLGWSFDAVWASFDSPTGVVTGDRRHLDPRLRFALNRSWGFVRVSGGVRSTGYDLANVRSGVDPRPRRDVGVGVLDAGMFLERKVSLSGGTGIQTLEPRLYYLRQSYADQDDLPVFDTSALTFSYRQLFRDNRYAGLDRIVDSNQLSVGVVSRILDASGSERLAARLGAMVHLEEPRVGLGSAAERASDAVGELVGRFGRLRIVSRLAWDTEENELGELGAGLSYRRGARGIFNLAYRRRFPDIDQTEVSFHCPVPGMDDRVSAFVRWNQDWGQGQIVEAFAGFAYTGCCLAVKLLWHRTIDVPRNRPEAMSRTDRGVMLQISLKGLGGFGSKVDSRLVRGIKGYRPGSG